MSSAGMLMMIVMVLVIVLIILIMMYFFLPNKSKDINKSEEKEKSNLSSNKSQYNIQSVFQFMNFDKIEDNMIVQKKGKRFLMVVECQGINYDLMSEVEKNAVESGFIGFLNSLKNPIQIHIQTRTINLENCISGYKERLRNIESQLAVQDEQYRQMQRQGGYSIKQLNNKQMEVNRLKNLYAYGRDIVRNTESMSLNKNILRKKYYIIVSYYHTNIESTDELLSEDEVKDVAFSELYTKCQSMIRVLSTTGVTGRVLDSYELADLLYNAYNRDSAETFGVNKATEAGYDELYVTSQDILDKKMNTIDRVIENKAIELAESAILKASEEKQQELQRKEKNLDQLVNDLAQSIILENADALGTDVAQKSMEYIEQNNPKNKGKEADVDAKEEKKPRKRTKKQ
ncbi:MAG: hypothetical protein HFJ17_01040 [Clostridia bacterium]|nr:hypothetical protein [Clostridia bacterium]